MFNSLNQFTDIDYNDTDLYLGNVKGGFYFYINITVANVENEIAGRPSIFHIGDHPILHKILMYLDTEISYKRNLSVVLILAGHNQIIKMSLLK